LIELLIEEFFQKINVALFIVREKFFGDMMPPRARGIENSQVFTCNDCKALYG
jgi:hypothetical protein